MQARRSFLHYLQHPHAAFEVPLPEPSKGFRRLRDDLNVGSRWPMMAHDRSKVALRFPMIGLRCPQDGLQVPSYGVSSVSQQCFFGILQFLPSNIADESQIYCRRALWDHLRAVFIFQGKLHFLKMGLPCRRDAHFYIISSTFTPPSRSPPRAFQRLQESSRRPQRGLKMAPRWFRMLLTFSIIGLRSPHAGVEVPPPTMFSQCLSSAPLAFCNVCHQT